MTRLLGDMLAKRGARVPDGSGLTHLKELAARLRVSGEEGEVLLSPHEPPSSVDGYLFFTL